MTDQTKKPRRRRVDSIPAVVDAVAAGRRAIMPPADMDMTDRELAAFGEVIGEQSKSELSAHKIRLSAFLAIDIAALDQEKVLLRREGAILINTHGNARANPRAKVVQNLTASILSQRRSLAIHTRALEGTNQRAALRRAHNKNNESFLSDLDDDLLAMPVGDHDEETKH